MKDYEVIFKDKCKEALIICGVDAIESLNDSYEVYAGGVCLAIIPKDEVYIIKTTDIEDFKKQDKVDLYITFKYRKNDNDLYAERYRNTTNIEEDNEMYMIYDENGILATIAKDSVLSIKRLTNN